MAIALLIVPTPDPNVTLLSIDGGVLARLGNSSAQCAIVE